MIRAAEQVGVQIPRFCDHPLLAPVGACRQCLVDVPDAGNGRGFPKPQASCTLPVAEGMVVNTQVTSPVADKAQQGVMEFLLINHPLDCPVCDKGGECPLQNQAMSNGRGESRFSGGDDGIAERQAHLPQADQPVAQRAARPRALHRLPAVHPLRRRDRGRPVHRDARARRRAAGRHRRGRAVPVLLLRQRHPDLPRRCPHLGGVPVPVPSVRPGVQPRRRRARRLRLRDPRRPPARQGDAPAGRRRPRGQRGVDHRQGPVRVQLRPRRRPDHLPAGPRRRRRPAPRVVAGGVRRRGPRPGAPPRTPVVSAS